MKKIAILLTCLTVVTSFVACSNNDATPTNERTQQANTSTVNMITGEVSVTGKVTQIYGNELLLRLAETTETSQVAGGRGEMSGADGEVAERPNMTDMSDEDRASMRENMSNGDGVTAERGQRNAQQTEVEDEEVEVALSSVQSGAGYSMGNNTVTSMSIGGVSSFIQNGGGGMDRSNMSDADREAMMSQMGDRGTMTSGTTTSTDDIVLTNDISEYIIPVGTPVYSMGTALSFSQISKDAYITIYMNKDNKILSVNILG